MLAIEHRPNAAVIYTQRLVRANGSGSHQLLLLLLRLQLPCRSSLVKQSTMQHTCTGWMNSLYTHPPLPGQELTLEVVAFIPFKSITAQHPLRPISLQVLLYKAPVILLLLLWWLPLLLLLLLGPKPPATSAATTKPTPLLLLLLAAAKTLAAAATRTPKTAAIAATEGAAALARRLLFILLLLG